jgi:hypothetical protein
MRAKFAVTFETYTTDSVSEGDADARGYLIEAGTLRECVEELNALDALDVIEPDCWPISHTHPPRSFRATQGSDRYLYAESEDDEGESRTLHLPDSITPASRLRVARLLGVTVR